MAKFGIRSVGGQQFAYSEGTAGESAAVGINTTNGHFHLVVSPTANASTSGTPRIDVDTALNGNILITPDGSGVVQIPTEDVTTSLILGYATQGVLQTDAVGVVTSSTGTDGQLLINDTATGVAAWANITAGSGISVANGANTIAISSTGGGMTWNEETGAAANLVINEGFIANNAAALVTFTLPATASRGDVIRVAGNIAGMGWVIAQNANQYITIGASTTTVGVGGSLASTVDSDAVELLCVDGGASTGWSVISSMGNITVV